jgi:hypothetical protein
MKSAIEVWLSVWEAPSDVRHRLLADYDLPNDWHGVVARWRASDWGEMPELSDLVQAPAMHVVESGDWRYAMALPGSGQGIDDLIAYLKGKR